MLLLMAGSMSAFDEPSPLPGGHQRDVPDREPNPFIDDPMIKQKGIKRREVYFEFAFRDIGILATSVTLNYGTEKGLMKKARYIQAAGNRYIRSMTFTDILNEFHILTN